MSFEAGGDTWHRLLEALGSSDTPRSTSLPILRTLVNTTDGSPAGDELGRLTNELLEQALQGEKDSAELLGKLYSSCEPIATRAIVNCLANESPRRSIRLVANRSRDPPAARARRHDERSTGSSYGRSRLFGAFWSGDHPFSSTDRRRGVDGVAPCLGVCRVAPGGWGR